MKPKIRATVFALLLTVAIATVAFAQTGALSLLIRGSVVSKDVLVIDGRAYVPLADVAKAYHQTLVKRPGGYELTDGGAAPPTENAPPHAASSQAAAWSLSVTGVDQVTSYNLRHDPSGGSVSPAHADDGLVIINCKITNGRASARTLGLSSYFATLTDDQGSAHKPIAFDAGSVRTVGSLRGVTVPADGTQEIAVVFSISQESSPKTFAFTLTNLTSAGFDTAHRKDVRIPL